MSGRLFALAWAIAGAALLLGTVLLYGVQPMFALIALCLSLACFAIAGACLLAPPPKRPRDEDAPPPRRRHWRP